MLGCGFLLHILLLAQRATHICDFCQSWLCLSCFLLKYCFFLLFCFSTGGHLTDFLTYTNRSLAYYVSYLLPHSALFTYWCLATLLFFCEVKHTPASGFRKYCFFLLDHCFPHKAQTHSHTWWGICPNVAFRERSLVTFSQWLPDLSPLHWT